MQKTNEHSSGKKIIIFFTQFLRIDDVIKWSAISLLGFLLGISSGSLENYLIPFGVFLVCTYCIMSFTFAVNNYFDADSDRRNPRRMHKNAIASGVISKKVALISNCFLAILALIISLVFSPFAFLFCGFLLLWMGLYSIPPFRLKGRPGVDVLWHFIAFASIILWGNILSGPFSLMSFLIAVSVALFSCIGQVWNHYVDYEFDKESGTKTYAVHFGRETTKKTIQFFLALHLLFLLPLFIFYIGSYLITLLVVLSGLVIGFLLLRPKKDGFPTKRSFEFYGATMVGGAVYISCLVYHLFPLFGINLLKFI